MIESDSDFCAQVFQKIAQDYTDLDDHTLPATQICFFYCNQTIIGIELFIIVTMFPIFSLYFSKKSFLKTIKFSPEIETHH